MAKKKDEAQTTETPLLEVPVLGKSRAKSGAKKPAAKRAQSQKSAKGTKAGAKAVAKTPAAPKTSKAPEADAGLFEGSLFADDAFDIVTDAAVVAAAEDPAPSAEPEVRAAPALEEPKEPKEERKAKEAKEAKEEKAPKRLGAKRRERKKPVLPENDADIPFDPMTLPEPPGGFTGVLSKPVDPKMPNTAPARLPDHLLVERARLALEDEEALRQKKGRLGLGTRTNPLTAKLRGLLYEALEDAADRLVGRAPDEFNLVPLNPVRVVLALSGGRDSMALLDVAARLLKEKSQSLLSQLTAVYVNHGLSPNADQWEAHCRTECERRGVPFRAVRVSVTPEGDGVEARARELRYKALADEAVKLEADIVMTAHHEDDRIETFLIQWLRGAGPEGLAAFPRERMLTSPGALPLSGAAAASAADQEPSLFSEADSALGAMAGEDNSNTQDPHPLHAGGLMLVRPWCEVPAEDIHRYVRNMKLKWVEDESNADPSFIRNRIRNEVLPLLESIRPGFRAAAARSVALVAETCEVLKSVAQTDLERCRSTRNPQALSIFALLQLVPSRQAWCLRAWMAEHGMAAPSKARLEEMLRQLREASSDINVHVRVKDREVRRWGSDLVVRDAEPEAPETQGDAAVRTETIRFTGGDWTLPDRGGVLAVIPCAEDEPGIALTRLLDPDARIEVSNRRGGAKMKLWPARPSAPLKDLYIEAEIPAFERPAMPLLRINGALVYASGLGLDLRQADDPVKHPERVRFEFHKQKGLWEAAGPVNFADLPDALRREKEEARKKDARARRREDARRKLEARAKKESGRK